MGWDGSEAEKSAATVLCVEDESLVGTQLVSLLNRSGFAARLALTASAALEEMTTTSFQAALVDWNLGTQPSGLELCAQMREIHAETKIIIVSARDAADDRITALDAGADDYVTKPFDPRELFARLRAVLRRGPPNSLETANNALVRWGTVALFPLENLCKIRGNEFPLTGRQVRILARLIRARGAIVTRDELWRDFGVAQDANPMAIRVHVHALRRRLGSFSELIQTIPGVGYYLSSAVGDTEHDSPLRKDNALETRRTAS